NELCGKIRQNDIIYKDEIIRITASFGVAEGTGLDLEEVIKTADDRLYTAKENGRNRVVAS
ncbi:MAG: diguanylate cyclase domain-containing protein, partial [Butyrivibrio sp.]